MMHNAYARVKGLEKPLARINLEWNGGTLCRGQQKVIWRASVGSLGAGWSPLCTLSTYTHTCFWLLLYYIINLCYACVLQVYVMFVYNYNLYKVPGFSKTLRDPCSEYSLTPVCLILRLKDYHLIYHFMALLFCIYSLTLFSFLFSLSLFPPR